MTMDVTPRWGLPQLFAGQAQKELFHNEALARIDMLLHGQAESADLTAPPISPTAGACWIVADGATDGWDGRDGAVAGWTDGGWRFVNARAGMCLWVSDRGHAMQHDGTAWRDVAIRDDGLYMEGERVVGPRAGAIPNPAGGSTADAEARNAIMAILAAMRTHGLIGT